VGELAKDDEEYDEGRNPRPKFVSVNDLVPKKSDEEGAEGDNDDASPSG